MSDNFVQSSCSGVEKVQTPAVPLVPLCSYDAREGEAIVKPYRAKAFYMVKRRRWTYKYKSGIYLQLHGDVVLVRPCGLPLAKAITDNQAI